MHTKVTRVKVTRVLGVACIALATQAAAQVTLYEGEGFRGRAMSASGEVRNLAKSGFNDRASSAVVERRPLGSVRTRAIRRQLRGLAQRKLRHVGGNGPR